MPAKDRIAKTFVEAALEFYRLRVWRHVPPDAPILLHIPTEEHPLVVVIIGQDGESYGFQAERGEGAFARMLSIVRGLRSESSQQELDFLCLGFDPMASIPADARRWLEVAGFRGRRERVAPWPMAKRPYENLRAATRGELRTLAWTTNAIVAALRAGELRVGELNERRRRILSIEVEGKPARPSIRARVVPWPDTEPARVAERPALEELPAGLAGLPRLDASWALGTARLPGAIAGDPRAPRAFLVVDRASGRVLANAVVMGDELSPAVETLIACMRGDEEGPAGLPREIVFDDEGLHEWLGGALVGLGIATRSVASDPGLRSVQDALEGGVEDYVRAQSRDEPPESLEEWKALFLRITHWIVQRVEADELVTPRALTRYFGSEEVADVVLDELVRMAPYPAFLEWLAADYRATKRSKTAIEKWLARKDLDPYLRLGLEARRDAVLSLWRIDEVEPGVGFTCEDVLLGGRRTVTDKALSGAIEPGLCLPLRLVRMGEWTFPALAGPVFMPLQTDLALRCLTGAGAEGTPESLRADAARFGALWAELLEAARRPTHLQNTDGETLRLHEATFRVSDPAALIRALDDRTDVEVQEPGAEWDWCRENLPGRGPGETTLLARLELYGDELLVEVNSLERLARARDWIEQLPGVSFERSVEREFGEAKEPLDDRLPDPPEAPMETEMVEALSAFHLEQSRRWLDERVPALGLLTPRQACATAEGRVQVARLIRTMPDILTPEGSVPAPRHELLRELGLEV